MQSIARLQRITGFAVLVSLCFGWLALVSAPPAAAQAVTSTVVGLSIAQEDPDSEYGGSIVPGLAAGTRVYVRVALDGKTIIRVETNESKPVVIRDSGGQTLPPDSSNIAFMSEIADDGQSVVLPFGSPQTPAKNATSLDIRGVMVLVCGAEETTREVEVGLKKKATFSLAGLEARVTAVGDSFEEGHETFTIETKKPMSRIKSLHQVLPDGSTAEIRAVANSEWGFGDDMTYQREFDVAGKVSEIRKLKVTYFQKLEKIEAPLDLKLSLGFGN